jgi:hypothetical protein
MPGRVSQDEIGSRISADLPSGRSGQNRYLCSWRDWYVHLRRFAILRDESGKFVPGYFAQSLPGGSNRIGRVGNAGQDRHC